MQNDDENSVPKLPAGWQTGSMRKFARGGNAEINNGKIRALAETLARDIAEQVTDGNLAEAAALVEANLIGVRQSLGSPTIAANPDAQRLLDLHQVPKLQSGWQTGSMRTKEWGGRSITHNKRILALAETLARDIAEQVTDGNLAEAVALVEANLIGMRQPKKGFPAIALNPEAQRLLNESESRWRLGTIFNDEDMHSGKAK